MLLIGYDRKRGFINYDPGTALEFKEGTKMTAKSATSKGATARMIGNVRYVSEKCFETDTAGGVWGFF